MKQTLATREGAIKRKGVREIDFSEISCRKQTGNQKAGGIMLFANFMVEQQVLAIS